ncbi:MAG: hydroxyacid dehydrogenase [Armatimonadetes bacterium]|nr:hydroxyacid dehydrogenase [Armatimonadota bacterium]
MSKPKILYAPVAGHTARVFQDHVYRRLLERFDVTVNEGDKNYAPEELARRIPGFEGLVTGWGTPAMGPVFFENADRLSVIAHSAGSIKHLFTQAVVDEYLHARKITVFSANLAIAFNVAEATVGLMIMVPRRWFEQALTIRATEAWHDPNVPPSGQYLLGSTVGIVSASKVGREVIRLLAPFQTHILCYDPYLTDWDAGRLGVERVSLNDLFSRSDIVSLHAPNIQATRNMIGAEQIRLLRDGATLINTSRGAVLDHDDLLAEARTGRIQVALDVTEPEPLPGDHPLRKLSNVLIFPHVSGAGAYGYHQIGETTLQALEDHFAARPVSGAVPLDRFDLLA